MCDYVCGCRTGALGAHIGPVTTTRIRATRWLIRSECLGWGLACLRGYRLLAPCACRRLSYRPVSCMHTLSSLVAYTRYRPVSCIHTLSSLACLLGKTVCVGSSCIGRHGCINQAAMRVLRQGEAMRVCKRDHVPRFICICRRMSFGWVLGSQAQRRASLAASSARLVGWTLGDDEGRRKTLQPQVGSRFIAWRLALRPMRRCWRRTGRAASESLIRQAGVG